MPAEAEAHRRQHLLGEGVLLARAEAHEQRGREHVGRHRLLDRRLDGPAALARVLDDAREVLERRILRHRASERLPADERYDLNLADVAEVWRRGSVVTSWLLDLTASALAKDGHLEAFSGNVEDSGEGRWTIEAAIEEAVPADVLAASLFVRFRSRQQHTFAEKVLSAMRLGFGGHVEAPKK